NRPFRVQLRLCLIPPFGRIIGEVDAVRRPLVPGFQHRIVQSFESRTDEIVFLVQDDLEGAVQRAFDCRTAQLGISLRSVRVANRQQATFDSNRIIHRGALADPPIIDVAAGIARRNRVDDISLLGRQAYHAEMWAYRNAHILQDAMVFLDRRVIDWNARIVDGFVNYAGGVRLWSPSEIIHGFRPVALAGGVDFVDRDHFARLWLGEQVLIVKAPPCGRVAAESLSGILRIGARPGCDVDNAQLNHVTLLGAAYVDRTGA